MRTGRGRWHAPDHPEGLGRRAMGGFGWMLLSGGGQAILHVALLAVLARLVSPAEFGVASAALVVVAFTTVFAEAGIGPALVQRRQIEDRHVRAGFTFQVVVAVLLWSLLSAASDELARLFRMPGLAAVVPALTSVLVIRSLSLGEHLAMRALEFRKLALIEFSSWTIGYGGIAVVLAVRGHGLTAIVAGNVGQASLRTVLLWMHRPHAMRPLWDRGALGDLLTFGSGYTVGWWANFVARQGDNFVVGRWLGADALGLYTRAYSLMRQPASLFGTVVNRVLFPTMAAVQDDRRRLGRTYLRGVALVAVVVLPVSVVCALTSGELITVLLGERWLDLQPAFNVMVFGMLFRTSSKLSDSLAAATGHVYRRAWRQAVYAGLIIAGALIGQTGGIAGVAWGILVALAANFLLMAHLCLGLTRSSWQAFADAHVPGAALGAAVTVVAGGVTQWLRGAGASPVAILLAASAVTAGLVLVAMRFAPHHPRGRGLVRSVAPVVSVASRRPGSRRALGLLLGPGYLEAPRPAMEPAP